jgi:uncharacterized membrane protein YgcG
MNSKLPGTSKRFRRHMMGTAVTLMWAGAVQAQTIGAPLVAPLVVNNQTIGEVVCSFNTPTTGKCSVTIAANAPWCVTAGSVSVIALDQVGVPYPPTEHPDKEKDRRRHKHIKDNPHQHDGKYSSSDKVVRAYASSEREEEYKRTGGTHHDSDCGYEDYGDGGSYTGYPKPGSCAKVATSNFSINPSQVCLGSADPYSLTWRGTATPQSGGSSHSDGYSRTQSSSSTSYGGSSYGGTSIFGVSDWLSQLLGLSKPQSSTPPPGATGWLLQGNIPCPRADT